MAIFKNEHPDGFVYKSKEKDFVEVLKKLPENWWFWHEPVIQGGLTPDFVLWINEPEHPALVLLELKNWYASGIKEVSYDKVVLADREETNPIPKLKRVKENFNSALSFHYRTACGLQDLAIVPVLCFWPESLNKLDKLLREDDQVNVLDKSVVQHSELLGSKLVEIVKNYYSDALTIPPVISIDIKKTLSLYVDLRKKVANASGKIIDLKNRIPKNGNEFSILDDQQEGIVFRKSLGHQVVSGVSGTGKTIVLLSRMGWYAEQFPKEKQLFIVNQVVLSDYLRQKYQHQFAHSEDEMRRVAFKTFGGWFKGAYSGVYDVIEKAKDHERDTVITSLVDKALKDELKLNDHMYLYNKKIKTFGHIFVDEAHQMPTSWIRLLTRFAKRIDQKPNIWIAYDNGQGIYRDRKFIGKDVGLDLRGRTSRLQRIYRCGLIPWIFAACCYPESLQTYKEQANSDLIEFVRKGNWPKKVEGNTLKEQAIKLKNLIKDLTADKKHKLSDVVIFYAVAGYCPEASDKNEKIKEVLDSAFKDLSGIEWVAINKGNADWSSERVRACSFTSSQGIDAPISVFFAAESFNMFKDGSWVDPKALFYTVLTRSTDTVILTYKELHNDPKSEFLSCLYSGFKKAVKIRKKLDDLKIITDNNGDKTYKVNWENLHSYINQK